MGEKIQRFKEVGVALVLRRRPETKAAKADPGGHFETDFTLWGVLTPGLDTAVLLHPGGDVCLLL